MTPAPAQAAVPTITTFACPINNGGGRFECYVEYSLSTPATGTWSGTGLTYNEPGLSDYFGRCNIGSSITVTVTITNASGSVTHSRTFACKGGPIIL